MPGADDRLEDRDAEGGDRARHACLLAATHERRHPPDHDAAGHRRQRVAGVDRLRKPGGQRVGEVHRDAVGLERRDQAAVLGVDAVEVGRRAVGPVPAAVRVDQRLRALVPCLGPDLGQLVARSAHEHVVQDADLVVRAPLHAPYPLKLARIVEARLGHGRAQHLVVLDRRARCLVPEHAAMVQPWSRCAQPSFTSTAARSQSRSSTWPRPDRRRWRFACTASGVCRSDWNTVIGDTPSPLPAVLGHEGAGVVARGGARRHERRARRSRRPLVAPGLRPLPVLHERTARRSATSPPPPCSRAPSSTARPGSR